MKDNVSAHVRYMTVWRLGQIHINRKLFWPVSETKAPDGNPELSRQHVLLFIRR